MEKFTIQTVDYDDIFCMAKIGSNANPGFCVWVSPEPEKEDFPYLRYYNA